MLEQKIVELMTQAQQTVAKIAPEALELAIRQQFWSGAGAIAGGFVALIIGLIIFRFAWKLGTREGADWDYGPDIAIIPGAIALFALIAAMICLFDTWNWVSIFDPKTALFHRIFERLLN